MSVLLSTITMAITIISFTLCKLLVFFLSVLLNKSFTVIYSSFNLLFSSSSFIPSYLRTHHLPSLPSFHFLPLSLSSPPLPFFSLSSLVSSPLSYSFLPPSSSSFIFHLSSFFPFLPSSSSPSFPHLLFLPSLIFFSFTSLPLSFSSFLPPPP